MSAIAATTPHHRRRAADPFRGEMAVSVEAHRPSVLVCESDLQSARALKAVLRDAGLDMSITPTAEEALMRAALHIPDAAIIGTVPNVSGTEICRQLRQWSSIPIILVSEVSDEARIVDAFDAGADDYITTPFRPRELVARVRSCLRRVAAPEDARVLLDDGTRTDFAARLLQRHGKEVRLTPIEYKLLAILMRNRGRLLTHDALLRDVWGVAYAGNRQTLRAHVANLRRKLTSLGSTATIRTYARAGYLLEERMSPPPGQRSIETITPLAPSRLRAA
jgi:two-component system, OmpR family, KDP operon response regulator KdpE